MSLKKLESLEAAVAADPTDPRARLRLGDLYLRYARNADALAHYLHAARTYAKANASLKALAVFRECIALGADVEDEALEQARVLGIELRLDEPVTVSRGHRLYVN